MPTIPTFKQFSDQWYDTYVRSNNKFSEQRSKAITLKTHLVPFFGQNKLDEITNLRVEEYKVDKLKKGLRPKTINNHLSVLSKCLHTAEEWIGISLIPKIKLLRVPQQPFDFLSREEAQKLLNTIDDPKWYAMVLVALKTGMRLGELLALEWTDIDLEGRMLNVRHSISRGVLGTTKSNKERHIPLTKEIIAALRLMRKPNGFVFSRFGTKPLGEWQARTALHKFCSKSNMRSIGWHTLRHSFASHLAAAGISLIAVQQLLGHSDIRITMRYSHLAPSVLREAVEVL